MAVALLAGCGSPDTENRAAGADEATSAPQVATLRPGLSVEQSGSFASGDPSPTPSSNPEMRLETSMARQEPVSCSAQVGASAAAKLVRQCIAVSPATHPPCNAANSCALIRNEIARGCALIGKTGPNCATDPYGAQAAVEAIERYYDAINAHDYGAAWGLWRDGGDGNPEQTFDEFVKGFVHTRQTDVETGPPGWIEGGAGSLYITVPVTVNAVLDNGRRQRFTGSYVLRQPNRGIAASQGWRITSATLKPS